jgi:hypothetical protein
MSSHPSGPWHRRRRAGRAAGRATGRSRPRPSIVIFTSNPGSVKDFSPKPAIVGFFQFDLSLRQLHEIFYFTEKWKSVM